MKFAKTMLCLAALFTLTLGSAAAQVRKNIRPPIAKYQPYTSPALNMLGPGGPEFGYFTGTLPQEQIRQQQYNFNRDFMNFENQVNSNFRNFNQQNAAGGIQRTIGTTGHPTSFFNTGTYYPARR